MFFAEMTGIEALEFHLGLQIFSPAEFGSENFAVVNRLNFSKITNSSLLQVAWLVLYRVLLRPTDWESAGIFSARDQGKQYETYQRRALQWKASGGNISARLET